MKTRKQKIRQERSEEMQETRQLKVEKREERKQLEVKKEKLKKVKPKKEKLKNDAGDMPTKRLLHRVARSMGEISFQMCDLVGISLAEFRAAHGAK